MTRPRSRPYRDAGTSSRVVASRAASAKPRTRFCEALVWYLAAYAAVTAWEKARHAMARTP